MRQTHESGPASAGRCPAAGGLAARDLRLRRILCWAGHGLNDCYFFILPLVLPLILGKLDIQLRGAGVLVSAFLFAVAVSSYFSGRVADRLDSWKLIAAGFTLAALGTVCASFATTLPVLIGLFVLAGIGVGTFHPSTYAQFDRLAFPRSGRAFGLFEFWGSATVVLMFFVNGTLLAGLGWRGVLRLSGVAGLLMALLYCWKFRSGGSRDGEQEGPALSSGRLEAQAGRALPLLLFLLATVLRFLSAVAVLNFTPTFLVLERGLSPDLAAYASAFIFVGGMVLCPLLGIWADRRGALPLLLLVSGAIGPLILLLSLPLPLWLLPPLLALLGGFISGSAPAQNLFLSGLRSGPGIGAAFGMMMGLIALIASLSPALFGYLAEHLGLATGLRLFSLPAGLSLVILAVLSRLEEGSRRPARGRAG